MSKEVILLWGLPGCGKTTYAENQAGSGWISEKAAVQIVNGDAVARRNRANSLEAIVKNTATKLKAKQVRKVIVDSLLTTNAGALDLMEKIQETQDNKPTFRIVYWKEDRESCLYNDSGRRDVSSAATIKNMVFETPDHNVLHLPKSHIVCKTIVRKPSWKKWADENKIQETIVSNSWCTGGAVGSYLDNEVRPISPDDKLDSFDELDKLLETISPTITFLQYKRIYRECVTLKTDHSSDYYGGWTDIARYVCDVQKLHKELLLMGYIHE